jgi:hypothetical protein
VEAGAECVCDHLQRPDHPDRQLTNAKVGSTVNRTAPDLALLGYVTLIRPRRPDCLMWLRSGMVGMC